MEATVAYHDPNMGVLRVRLDGGEDLVQPPCLLRERLQSRSTGAALGGSQGHNLGCH